ncbi:transposase [Microbacterium sp. VKM Ac-2923]|uniref:transposase n=1 Tax=Microbacterium sp. VKM Ac-2923 TaxID=2929476 RepID=UPI001FB2DB6F|nr:transposase [Microbacterium sp. VKM Ac-2923]MCJ1706279.1 transposase [Microbacterium sp. VKM Ac-2923]
MSDDDARLDEAAADLLLLPPARFTTARNERAADVGGAAGRRIAKLRKPTVAAWAVNLLVHDGQLGEAVELSRALREAQDDRDAAELARLGRQRRQLVSALARRAGELAADAGTPLSAAMADAVEKTVNAAIVDETAAAAILTGRLVSAVDLADLDGDALGQAVAGSLPDALPTPPPRDDLAARRARKAAERAVREAERARADAEREQATAEKKLAGAREKADRAHERVDALRGDLARAEKDAADADAVVHRREGEREDAADGVRAARRAVERAQAQRDDGGDA